MLPDLLHPLAHSDLPDPELSARAELSAENRKSEFLKPDLALGTIQYCPVTFTPRIRGWPGVPWAGDVSSLCTVIKSFH